MGIGLKRPDHLHPLKLKNLPDSMLDVVWSWFRRAFENKWVSQRRRVGKIIPDLKAEKNACELSSYRPVRLTSCMGKWFKRVIVSL